MFFHTSWKDCLETLNSVQWPTRDVSLLWKVNGYILRSTYRRLNNGDWAVL